MAFRENIEAILKVKNVARFKGGMETAAKSVRGFGKDEEQAAAQTKLLEQIMERLDRQSAQTAAAMTLVANSVDELGDEMVQTAAKASLMNTAMKKSGSNAVFLGKSWAFWKDRLSLTRSEIVTTTLTIATYFSPAIIAMGSSFAYAAIGGGGVAAAGLSTFIFGLVGLATVIKPVTDNLKKITKAQDMYNLTVEQYGASSEQASRQAAHLYGVVKTQGGAPMLKAAQNLAKFKKEWSSATNPARGSILSIISGGTGTLRKLTPTLSLGINQMAIALNQGMGGLFRTLQGKEMRANFHVMAQTFDRAIGPGIKGATNALIVFGRVIRAAAPWVVQWADAWQRTTHSWRESTSDQGRVEHFLNGAVTHFKAWWNLAKAVGRVLKTIFKVSKDEGLGFVQTLTVLVNRFDGWLNRMNDTGKVAKFWTFWKNSISDAFEFLTHPDTWMPTVVAAIDRWMPVIMNHIATGIVTTAPTIARSFLSAFMNAGAWAKFFASWYLLKKFGVFKLLGSAVAGVFIKPFIGAFGSAFTAAIGGEALAGSLGKKMGAASQTAGKATGRLFGKFFIAGMIAGIILFGPDLRKALSDMVPDPFKGLFAGPEDIFNQIFHPGRKKSKEGNQKVEGWLKGLTIKKPKFLGGAAGGVIPPGGFSLVGESGPELATAGARGTSIVPLSRNGRNTLGPVDIPNLQGAMHITVYSHVNVDKREIGRAVTEQTAYDTTRRGGLRRPR